MADGTVAAVTVRYFAGARAAAGTGEEHVEISREASLDELAGALAVRHGAALGRVLASATFLVDEVSVARDAPLRPGATVDVLPPFAGG